MLPGFRNGYCEGAKLLLELQPTVPFPTIRVMLTIGLLKLTLLMAWFKSATYMNVLVLSNARSYGAKAPMVPSVYALNVIELIFFGAKFTIRILPLLESAM